MNGITPQADGVGQTDFMRYSVIVQHLLVEKQKMDQAKLTNKVNELHKEKVRDDEESTEIKIDYVQKYKKKKPSKPIVVITDIVSYLGI